MSARQSRASRLVAWSADHRGLLAILACTSLAALVYGALTPPFEGPDAAAHLTYAAYLRSHPGYPPLDAETAAISHQLVQQPPLYYQLVAALTAPLALTPTLALYVENPQWPEHSPRATLTLPGVPLERWLPARIAALVSLLGALLAVISAYGLTRALVPGRPELATAAAAVVGLNPQFVFSAGTTTNDTWVTGAAALAVWLAALAAKRAPLRRRFLWGAACGGALGLAFISKYSGLVAIVPVGVLVLFGLARDEGWSAIRGTCASLAGLAGGVLVVAGGWYGHNLVAYGALVPLDHLRTLLGDLARAHPAKWARVWQEAAWLPRSYWGVFGYGEVAPSPYDDITNLIMLAGGLGLVVGAGRRLVVRFGPGWSAAPRLGLQAAGGLAGALPPHMSRANMHARRSLAASTMADARPLQQAAVLALSWLGAQLVCLLQWIRLMHFGNQGRLLFPAAPAVALLIVLGVEQLASPGLRHRLPRLIPVVMVALALWQTTTLHAAYDLPPAVAAPVRLDRPAAAHFAGGMTLLGADLPRGDTVRSGGVLPVTLYWTTSAPIAASYRLFLHLAGPDDHVYARFDGVPYAGRHDTRQWVPGAVFADHYELALEGPPAPGGGGVDLEGPGRDGSASGADAVVNALLSAGFTDLASGERLPLLGPDGQVARRPDGEPAAERAELGPIEITGRQH